MALEVSIQQDFSGGMYQSPAAELIPQNGCAQIVNGLLDVDGSVYRRGGCDLKMSVSSVGPTATFLWDGYLKAGARTVIGGTDRVGVVNSADNAVTPIDDLLAIRSLRPAVGNNTLVMARADGTLAFYAGARKDTTGAGAVTTTSGSPVVNGGVGANATFFSGNVDAGMFLIAAGVGPGAPDVFLGVVKSVQSNTQLTLYDPALAVVTSRIYALRPVYPRVIDTTNGAVSALATVSNPARLVTAAGSRVSFTAAGDFLSVDPTDYHELPQGAQVLGMESLRNVLFVFSTQGVFTISGMDYDLTDASGNVQQRLEQINRDIILWDQRGIAGWSGALVVPGTDDVYLITESAAPRALSEPIRTLYRGYVAAGYQCGGATVYRNHYFLPILNGTTWVDTLVLRLDAGGWVQWDGDGGKAVWLVTRGTTATARAPSLLSVYGTRLKDLSRCFNPGGGNRFDGDNTAHQFVLTTRDYTTGGLRRNLVKKVRLGYELADTTGLAMVNAYFNINSSKSDAPATMFGVGAANDAVSAVTFLLGSVRSRFVRFKFSSVDAPSRLVVRSVEMFTRAGGRQ